MRIAIDVMGGDYAPRAIVQGAVDAAREFAVPIILVGQAAVVERELAQYSTSGLELEIVDAPEHIAFDEQPAFAVKARKGLSMRVMCDLVVQGHADACITMGHSGAAFIAGLLTFGRIEGIARPAIGVPLLGLRPDTLLIDAAANVDSKPEFLLQFALMGSIYLNKVCGISNPRVALLANGTEDNKGNALIQAAFPLLKASGLNFVGNIEGYDIPSGKANVVVMDALLGNVVLKYTEGLAEYMLGLVQAALASQLSGDALARATASLADLRIKSDYAETGAVPLLGVNHIILIGHGRSNAKAVKSGIGQAMRAVQVDLVRAIREGLLSLR